MLQNRDLENYVEYIIYKYNVLLDYHVYKFSEKVLHHVCAMWQSTQGYGNRDERKNNRLNAPHCKVIICKPQIGWRTDIRVGRVSLG